jgi:hypothetical protein
MMILAKVSLSDTLAKIIMGAGQDLLHRSAHEREPIDVRAEVRSLLFG